MLSTIIGGKRARDTSELGLIEPWSDFERDKELHQKNKSE